MQVQIIQHENAISDGADLWILPSLQVSEWTRQLDWPLNLLLTKANLHPQPDLASELAKIVNEIELKIPAFKTDGKPLLIASEGRLPNRQTVILFESDAKKWLEAGLNVWRGLSKPKARMFLPAFAPWEMMKSNWPTDAESELIQIVDAIKNDPPEDFQ